MADNTELIGEFLIESHENLDRVDRELLALEKDPRNAEALASVFRTIHTIKGTCGFLGFNTLESVTHVGESLLSRVRDGEVAFTAEIATVLLSLVDAVRRMLAIIEATGTDGANHYGDVVAELTRLNQRDHAAPPVAAETTPIAEPSSSASPPPVMATAAPDAPLALVLDTSAVAADVTEPARAEVAEASAAANDAAIEASRRKGDSVADSSLRVDVVLLDKLMNLVGELVLARNQILQYTATQQDSSFLGATQRLNLVTSELQEGVMKTRMQPIGNVWAKFPRVVRDLSVACGKQVRIEMEGKDTDLDKTIIEAIKDPLTHVVRNSVDHGIEAPHVRRERNKNPEGTIRLRAFHEGGQINIEISDDGAGINADRVREKALQRGLVSKDQIERMSDYEVVRLIFLPGFSTAERVTNVSGRGVGMDVVKTNIEKIGGTVDIQSRPGHGTTLKIKIPLTLAIIPALMVTTGGERFAIPQVSLLELVRLEGDQLAGAIETVGDAQFYRLRGSLLPLVYLDRALGLAGDAGDAVSDVANIVVLKADDRQFGLVVGAINDTEEIVVKPLGKQLKGVTAFAGATIMGDGCVALILDVLGLAQRANVVAEVRSQRLTESGSQSSDDAAADQQALLLFSVTGTDRMAIPLSQVARLEEFPRTSIERAGNVQVVQYRGEILPLLGLSDYFGGANDNGAELLQVVVFAESGRQFGLVVDRILDIVTETVVVQRRAPRPGVLGSIVLQNRVTDLLDVPAILRALDPTLESAA